MTDPIEAEPETALPIRAAEKLKATVIEEAHQVAGLVKACSRLFAERVGNKFVRREFRTRKVTTSQPVATAA